MEHKEETGDGVIALFISAESMISERRDASTTKSENKKKKKTN